MTPGYGFRRYTLAAVSCGVALGIALLVDSPSSCFFLAVMVSALYGGKGPGIVSIALSALAFDYFWLPPQRSLWMQPSSIPRLAVFLAAAALGAVMIETKRRADETSRRTAAQVQRSEAYLAEAQRLGQTGSWACSPDLEFTYWSAELFRITGLPLGSDPPTMTQLSRQFPAEEWAEIRGLFETARRKAGQFQGEFQFARFDGPSRTLRMVGHPILDATGKVVELVGTMIDVTEQRQARAALQRAFDDIKRSEDQLRTIVDTIPTLAWSARPDGSIEFFNRPWLDYTGLSPKAALDWGWTVAIHPDDRSTLMPYWRDALASGAAGEVEGRLRRFDGQYRWFLFRTNPWRDESGAIVKWYGTNADIQDRKQAEEVLRASEQDLRLIVDGIPGMVYTSTSAGDLEFVSQQVREYTGKTLDGLQNWHSLIHPNERDRMVSEWAQSVETGRRLDVEFRLAGADGVYRWFHARVVPQRGSDGQICRWYGLITDIDSEKSAKEALLDTRSRLSRATQFATIGELAASIAHEVNQPLAAVVANGHACLRWLSAEPPSLAKGREAAERIVRDGKEAGEIVRRIRALFKRGIAEKAPVDTNGMIREVLSLLAGELAKRQVVLETFLAQDLRPVVGDRVQLQQLLLNLILNAMEAMDAMVDRPRKLVVRSRRQPDDHVLVEIRDFGTGLADSEKIFEAFFTTKQNGLGMGLAVCRTIVNAHSGRLWAVPGEGAGTSFFFTLPSVTLSSDGETAS
jgi:PAS domain S-box-containing protein